MAEPERPLPRGLRAASAVVRAGRHVVPSTEAGHGGSDQMRDLGPEWMVRYTRMHPICDDCYEVRYAGRPAVRIRAAMGQVEQCCDCGCFTESGIWIRKDPRLVQYPKLRD